MIAKVECYSCSIDVTRTEIFQHVENFHVGFRTAGSTYDIFCGECSFRSCELTSNRMIDHISRTNHKSSEISLRWTLALEKEAERVREIVDHGVEMLRKYRIDQLKISNGKPEIELLAAVNEPPSGTGCAKTEEKQSDTTRNHKKLETEHPKNEASFSRENVESEQTKTLPDVEVADLKENMRPNQELKFPKAKEYSRKTSQMSQDVTIQTSMRTAERKKKPGPNRSPSSVCLLKERKPIPEPNLLRNHNRNCESSESKFGSSTFMSAGKRVRSYSKSEENQAKNRRNCIASSHNTDGRGEAEDDGPGSSGSLLLLNGEDISLDTLNNHSLELSEFDRTLELQPASDDTEAINETSNKTTPSSVDVTLNKIYEFMTHNPMASIGDTEEEHTTTSVATTSQKNADRNQMDETPTIDSSQHSAINCEQCLQCGALLTLDKGKNCTQRSLIHHFLMRHSEVSILRCSACCEEFRFLRHFRNHTAKENCHGERISLRTVETTGYLRKQLQKCFPNWDFEHALNFSPEFGNVRKNQLQKPQVVAAPRNRKAQKGDCHLCPRDGLKSRDSMMLHGIAHTGLRLFECVNCKNRYRNLSSIKMHQKISKDPSCDGSFITVETPEDRAKIRATLSEAFPEFDWNQKFPPGKKWGKIEP